MTLPAFSTPRLGRLGATIPDGSAARAAYAASRALVCPGALEDDLLVSLLAACDRASFVADHVEGLGHREIERPAVAGTAITLALRHPSLFRWLEDVTGCKPISRVEGRVVQTYKRDGHELRWHDDRGDGAGRRLGITIGLGGADYEGGLFEMRTVPEGNPLITFRHDTPGTALIFEVSKRCEHRLHPLTSGGPRRVFTGWFLA